MKKLLLIMIIFALLLTGCAKDLPGYVLPADSAELIESTEATPTQTKEWEEFNTYPVDLDVDELLGHSDHEIVFLKGRYAHYYDFDLRRSFAFCSQPNCSHSDESCPAYFGGEQVMYTDYDVAGDSVYAACTTEDGQTFRLRQLKPLSGEKRDLYSVPLPEMVRDTDEDGTERMVYFGLQDVALQCTESAVIFQYSTTRTEVRFESDRQRQTVSGERVILRCDLNSGTVQELLRSELPIFGGYGLDYWLPPDAIEYASDRFALLRVRAVLEETPLGLEEYLKTGAAEEDYERYREELSANSHAACVAAEIQLWDLETGEKTPLCTVNDLRMDSDRALYQYKVCFVRNERELWQLDLKDGAQRKLLDLEVPGNFCTIDQWDGRVFFSTWRTLEDGSTWYDWYWYETATGELRQYQAESCTRLYYIMAETDRSFYVSDKDGKGYVIDKQDYYNENYAAAQNVGRFSLVN